jgi:hypothetical protein
LCSSSRKIILHIWPLLRFFEGSTPLVPLQNAPFTRLNSSEEKSPKYAFCFASQAPDAER